MTEDEWYQQRKTAIHMIRSGVPASEIAQQLGRSVSWVYKWRDRFKAESWAGLRSQSRAPKHCPQRLLRASDEAFAKLAANWKPKRLRRMGCVTLVLEQCKLGSTRKEWSHCPARPVLSACCTMQRWLIHAWSRMRQRSSILVSIQRNRGNCARLTLCRTS